MTAHLICQDLLLGLVTMFKQLLNNIVPEDIGHQLQGVGLNFSEDLLLLVTVGGLKLLLDEARPVLVTTELNHVVVDVLKIISSAHQSMKEGFTFSSYRLLPLLFARNSSRRGLRTTCVGS